MESPINKKIQRSLERSAAKKKKDSNYIPVLTLRQQVLSLVTEANASALQERQITPRSALTVMDRSIERLSALKDDAKDFAVLREVASYISTAQKTFVASASTHTDLLPQGHPLSSLNASLTPEEYRFKYSQWLAADPDVSHNARPLVAAAFSAEPGSLEREHAFMRLSVTSESVPGYFKLDPTPIVAAFSDGNSSSARRARVALQWRDKKGRWVEMGRGANFRFRLPDGSVASASGVYVGVRPSRPGEAKSPAGLIQISGDKNLSDGIYAVQPDNTETYSARIPTEALKKAGVKPGVRPDQAAVGIPTQDEITASRQDGPTGWTKQDENTFTSDDNYTAKVTDGEYTLFRQNADGSLGDKVGEGASWADINDLANNDEESYDVVKGQDSSAGRQEVKARIQGRTKYNEEFDRLEELVASGVDQNGNKVPAGWEATIKRGAMPEIERRAIGADRVFGEEGLPYLEYSKTYADDNGNPVTAKAMFMRDGKFYANDKEYDSWDAAEADIPNWIKAEEDKRDRKLTPIKSEETEVPALDRGDSGDSKKSYTVDFALDSDSYDEIGLDPEKDYTDEEVANAWIKSKGLDGKVEFVKADNPSGQWPEFTFKIDENSKDAFAEAYGYDSWSDLDDDQQFGDGDGPDEPPTPPTGGTPPKTPSPSTPSAPGLFSEFEAPNGAFKLRTADYDPEGRVDERSTDFTDDPERLATKFTVQDLISAFSEAIIGNSSDASVAEILNVNVDDDNELDAPSEVDLDAEIPQVSLGTPSGAGRLEFNAGEEFVPAEALFNALWHAGVDPNRVLANVYDSVNGDNKNLSKLIDAQGGTPSAEEAQLVDDITAEIRQIKDATPDDEPSIANQKNEPSEELTGSLLENLPIDFENPDYYIPDSSSYVPSQEEPDENGYTDNPELLAADYETSDLIMQMLEGITDGSGAALLNFGDITTEVPVEAIRDALQLQGVNTNDILVDLKRESNDMSEPDSDTPTLQAHSQMIKDLVEQTGNTLDDDTADKIRDAIDEQGLVDWSEASDEEIIEAIIDVAGPGIFSQENRDPRRFAPAPEEQPNFSPFSDAFEGEEDSVSPEQAEKLDSSAEALVNFFSGGLNGARIIAYNPQDGSIAASTRGTDLEDSQIILATAEGNVQSSAIVDEEWFGQDGAQLGWKPMSQEVVNSIYQENGRLFPSTAMSAPVVPDVVETEPQSNEAEIDSPENVTPQFNYPGPREAGYTANNVVRDSNGVAVGAGARVKALGDGRTGTILVVQNIDTRTGRDADYVRVRFDDGKVAVRSARQVFGIEGGSPIAEGEGPGQLPPARRNPVVQDPAQRFNEPPAAGTPVVAGDGSIPGVQLVDTPDDIKEFVNPDAKQSDFAMWGLRAPEIARAGRERADINKIVDLVDKEKEAGLVANDTSASREDRDKAISDQAAYKTQIETLIRDSFGVRPGVKFGRNNYTIGDRARVSYNRYASGEVEISIGFRILNENGDDIGEGSRTLNSKTVQNPDGTSTVKWEATNNILKIPNTRDKKSGFAESYNRYMEDWYIANGFERVKVYAAGDGAHWQGGLVWALNGFNWQDNQASQVPTILRRMASKPGITDEEKQIIKRMQDRIAKDNPSGNYTADTVPTPLEIALIGWYPGATNWVGKKYMVATSWYGQKRLNPEAIEQRQAINYNQSREARKRIEGKLNQAGISRELVLKMNSNEFADANPELAPYLDQIRDVLRNNRSLAVLSPAAKTALNRYTAGQLLKGEGRDATLQDIFKLRMALDAEFKADNPLAASSDFGVGSQLLDVSIDDVSRDNLPGFTVKRLGIYESGINDTYMVTHNDSGQIFYVKKDSYAAQYRIDGAGAEVQADAMLRASGVAGYEARVSNVDPEIIVMQRAGAGIPLLGDPMTATKAIGNQLTVNLPDGTTIRVDAKNFMDLLHTPEDAVRVILVDLIISNMDRHNGNLLLAVDGTDTGKIRILPIDHALSSFSPDTEGMQFTVEELFDNRGDNLYGMAMPVLTERLKQEEILDLFRNEARIMMTQLDNPANLPTGKELDLIVKNFGSLDAYRAKIQERINSLLSPGAEGYQAFLSALDPNYWSR
jgi:hypothetical protein